MYNITIFSKHTPVTDVLLLAKLASTRIASHADLTLGFCKISALTCCRGISRTKPALCCLKSENLFAFSSYYQQILTRIPQFPSRKRIYVFNAMTSCSAGGIAVPIALEYLSGQKLYFFDTFLKSRTQQRRTMSQIPISLTVLCQEASL